MFNTVHVSKPTLPTVPYTAKWDCHRVFKSQVLKGHSFDCEGYLSITPDGTITVRAIKPAPFYFDDCSPKFRVFGWTVLGTPNGPLDITTGEPVTRNAAGFHDILYQHLGAPGFTPTRKEIDKVFRELLPDNWIMTPIYYHAVRFFGGLYKRFVVDKQPKFIRGGAHLKNAIWGDSLND